MSAKPRIWVLLTAVLCLGLIFLGIVGGLVPQLSSAASTRSLAQDQSMLNDVQRARLAQLQDAKENLDQLESQLAELEKAIPTTAASAEWIEELHQAELRNGVVVNQFEVQVPLAQPEQEAPAAEEPEAAGDENGDETGPTSEPAPAPTFSGSQPIPVIIEVAGGSRESVTAFLRDVQVGGRLFLVQNIEILEDEREEGVFWRGQVQGFLYAKLD